MIGNSRAYSQGVNSPSGIGQIGIQDYTFQLAPAAPTSDAVHLQEGHRWQVVLSPVGHTDHPLALELQGDVVVGSAPVGDQEEPDINLAARYGDTRDISPRHFMLRPTPSKLFLLDLHSESGTFVNTIRLGTGWAYSLQENDLIGLGSFWIKLLVIRRP